MGTELTCVGCGYTIREGDLFVPVVRAADAYGTEAPIEDGQRLAMHVPTCPPLPAEMIV